MAHWYAIQTKARQEPVAVRELANQGYRTFLPLIDSARHSRGRWHSSTQPLFPGYLFVELDLATQNAAPIRSTRGVIGLVRCGDSPLPVPEGLVDQLMQAQAGRQAIPVADLLQPGDRVTLVDGPMAGIQAIFQARSGAERVVLLLELLGRHMQVTTSVHHVVPASD